jgi:hypothetical protein
MLLLALTYFYAELMHFTYLNELGVVLIMVACVFTVGLNFQTHDEHSDFNVYNLLCVNRDKDIWVSVIPMTNTVRIVRSPKTLNTTLCSLTFYNGMSNLSITNNNGLDVRVNIDQEINSRRTSDGETTS